MSWFPCLIFCLTFCLTFGFTFDPKSKTQNKTCVLLCVLLLGSKVRPKLRHKLRHKLRQKSVSYNFKKLSHQESPSPEGGRLDTVCWSRSRDITAETNEVRGKELVGEGSINPCGNPAAFTHPLISSSTVSQTSLFSRRSLYFEVRNDG